MAAHTDTTATLGGDTAPASSPSRRALFGAVAALPALAAATLPVLAISPALAAKADPDAELVRTAAIMVAGRAEAERLMEPYYELVGFTYPPETLARLERLSAQHHELRARLAEMPASGLAGCRAKAAALMLWLEPGGPEDAPSPCTDEYMVWSLCRDLLGVTANAERNA